MPPPGRVHIPGTVARPRACRRWSRPPESFPGDDAVHVWRIPLVASLPLVAHLRSLLSDEERARAERFLDPEAGRRFVVAHGAARTILARYLGLPARQVDFTAGAQGKPHLARTSGAPAPSFNLSHSGELALCAVARGGDVGVDLEQIRPLSTWREIAARYFSPEENRVLATLSGDRAVEAFFHGWTRKEAYGKALGQGVSRQWTRFTVSLSPEALTELPPSGAEDAFTLWPLAPGPGYAAAVAAPGRGWRPACWHWSTP